jgi:hypothetical protein
LSQGVRETASIAMRRVVGAAQLQQAAESGQRLGARRIRKLDQAMAAELRDLWRRAQERAYRRR